VLSHHPDCQPAGVRRVPNGRWGKDSPAEHNTATQGYGSNVQPFTTRCYADADGCEEVQAWHCHPSCAVRLLDEQAGPRTSKYAPSRAPIRDSLFLGPDGGRRRDDCNQFVGDTGSASRFFPTFSAAPEPADAVPFRYVPKASRTERDAGLENLPVRRGATEQDDSRWKEGSGALRQPLVRNCHPTVKPVSLMRWLVRLVTSPGGTVLDPFAGSGSTCVAAIREGLGFIAIEQEPAYVEIARRRIAHEQEQQTGPLFAALSSQG
jgi:hypothetical protein